jgi:hypothetical protein
MKTLLVIVKHLRLQVTNFFLFLCYDEKDCFATNLKSIMIRHAYINPITIDIR